MTDRSVQMILDLLGQWPGSFGVRIEWDKDRDRYDRIGQAIMTVSTIIYVYGLPWE